jgi:hypothetical protein
MTPGPTNSAVDIDLNKTVTKRHVQRGQSYVRRKLWLVAAEASEPKASERRGRSSCVDGDLTDFYLKTF